MAVDAGFFGLGACVSFHFRALSSFAWFGDASFSILLHQIEGSVVGWIACIVLVFLINLLCRPMLWYLKENALWIVLWPCLGFHREVVAQLWIFIFADGCAYIGYLALVRSFSSGSRGLLVEALSPSFRKSTFILMSSSRLRSAWWWLSVTKLHGGEAFFGDFGCSSAWPLKCLLPAWLSGTCVLWFFRNLPPLWNVITSY